MRAERRERAAPPPREDAGVGILFERGGGEPVVKDMVAGGAAALDGTIGRGDALLAVDGRDVAGLGLDEIAGLIRGTEGTEVRLTVLRRGGGGALTVALARSIPALRAQSSEAAAPGPGPRAFANTSGGGTSAGSAPPLFSRTPPPVLGGSLFPLAHNGHPTPPPPPSN